ncbi:MAG TPA: Hsp70 family protein [Actinocatenispora sp.]
MAGWTLAVDFGTSNTVAALRRPDGRAGAVLFDGSPLLPSAVYADADGTLLTGRDAVHSARLAPARFEPNPKLRVDDGTVLLGADVPVAELFGAVLGRVAREVRRVAGGEPGRVILTYPAGWGTHRRGLLTRAAADVGFATVELVAEPVAAARFFGTDGAVAADGTAVIYDLGAGTADVSVVRGDRILATDGLVDAGGLDVDAAIVAYLAAQYGERDPAAWQRLRQPTDDAERRERRRFVEDVRSAKEMLSRTAQAFVHVPWLDVDVPIGRDQLDTVAEPLIARTVRLTRATIVAAGLPVPPPGPLYLVGGASRMPLVATMLHQQLGVAPILTEQPELVVADGALATAAPEVPSAVTLVPPRTGDPVSPVVTPGSDGVPVRVSGEGRAAAAGVRAVAAGVLGAAALVAFLVSLFGGWIGLASWEWLVWPGSDHGSHVVTGYLWAASLSVLALLPAAALPLWPQRIARGAGAVLGLLAFGFAALWYAAEQTRPHLGAGSWAALPAGLALAATAVAIGGPASLPGRRSTPR